MFFKISSKIKTKNKVKIKKKLIILLLLLAFFVIWPISPTFSFAFNPHNIITDKELLDKNYLSKSAIQTFLERENSVLARFSQIVKGEAKKASEIIWEISQNYDINPAFLLATLEREQGLIHKSHATEKALDWATGYSCYGGKCNEKYKGFYDQVESTAITQKIYISQSSRFSFQPNIATKTFDNYTVIPENQATANLYIYTPYIGYTPELGITQHNFGGNKLFWTIWNRYFTYKKYPNGLVLKNNGDYWLIQNGKKRKFKLREVFLKDWEETDALSVSKDILEAYINGPEIIFSNNTLVRSNLTGQAFLLSNNKKRPIIDDQGLALLSDFRLAVSLSEIPEVSNDYLQPFTEGNPISASSIYPQGKLFKDESNQIYLVQDGLKHLIDPIVWQINFKKQNPKTATTKELEKYPLGSPVKLKDGTLVKNNNKYYLISDSERIRIEYPEILNQFFSPEKLKTALVISQELLELHPPSEVNIAYIDTTIKDPTPTTNNVTAGTGNNYQASFQKIEPESLVLLSGETKTLKLSFKNTGNANWQKGKIWLKLTDTNSNQSSFLAKPGNIDFDQTSVNGSESATFTFEIFAPNRIGLIEQKFTLYYDKNGAAIELISIGKFILIKSGVSSEIISHNLPLAVRNNWRPLNITMKIKNTSTDTVWLSRRTALEIYDGDGSQSSFYDSNDWVRKEVAAVPINKSLINPGEIGEFKFTIAPQGLKPGLYTLKFKLNLLDKEKQSLLNGQSEWHRLIRVDD